MSAAKRTGIRAARALLSLIEENSAEELEAAESILGSEQDLVKALQLLRSFKMRERAHDEPLSVGRFREIVRREILDMPLSVKDLIPIANSLLGPEGSRSPPRLTIESVLDQVLAHIDATSPSPREEADAFIKLLIHASMSAGPEHEKRITSLLRDLAIQALTENIIRFPTPRSLAEMRTAWGPSPLPYHRGESRQQIVTRLLDDAERLQPKKFLRATLLLEGLRSPVDGAMAEVRELNAKKKARGA